MTKKLSVKRRISASREDRCPVCLSVDTKEWYKADINTKEVSFSYAKKPEYNKTFRVVRCYHCSHVFCSPLPKDIYKKYEDIVDEEYLKHSDARKSNAAPLLSIIASYKSSGNLLDVGCATGDFLIVAKKLGYSVEGLELSEWSSKVAKKRGLRIHREQLKSHAKKFASHYDIITLWGVIEHFENPRLEMRYIKTLLKPGGILVLWTGDVDSITSRVLGRRWWYWQGQHIQYFTKQSLHFLGTASSIDTIAQKYYPFVMTFSLLENAVSRYHFRFFLSMLLKPLFIVKASWTLRIPGEMLWIGRKES